MSGCAFDPPAPSELSNPDAAPVGVDATEAGSSPDAGREVPPSDGGAATDARALADAAPADLGVADAGFEPDAGVELDAGVEPDAGSLDAGIPEDPPDAGQPCGNGALEVGEQCDDANLVGGDGCSSACSTEPGWGCEGQPSQCAELPSIAVRDTATTEGEPATFLVELSSPAPFEVAFDWSTQDGSAVAGADYVGVTGATVQLARGARTATLSVATVLDSQIEGQEDFQVLLTNVTGARLDRTAATASVENADVLVDRGLVARYFLDDVGSGQPLPATMADAAPNPLDLSVLEDLAGEPDAVERTTGRGLTWDRAGRFGRIGALTDGTKIQSRLDRSRTGTLEVVARVDDAVSASRLVHIGELDLGEFSLLVTNSIIVLAHGGDDQYRWSVAPPSRRAVYTLVFDSTLGDRSDRIRLYIDGVDQGPANAGVDQNTEIRVPAGRSFLVGNRTSGGYSPEGDIYYAAVYDSALDPSEVATNVSRLLARDDL